VAIAAQGVTGEHDTLAMQPDAARRVAGHVHHLPPGHLVAIVQQQVRSDRADPEHPADHLLNRAALGRQLTAGQHRRVQLVDRHASPGPPAQLLDPAHVIGMRPIIVPIGKRALRGDLPTLKQLLETNSS
jgi:hypothetical protein